MGDTEVVDCAVLLLLSDVTAILVDLASGLEELVTEVVMGVEGAEVAVVVVVDIRVTCEGKAVD